MADLIDPWASFSLDYEKLVNKFGIAKVSDIPTTTSALINDSGFITNSDIPVTDVTVGGTSVVSSGTAAIPTIPTTLAALTGDVTISSPTDGQSLIYDGNTSKWKNVSATVSVGFAAITGSPYDNVALAAELNNIDCGTLS